MREIGGPDALQEPERDGGVVGEGEGVFGVEDAGGVGVEAFVGAEEGGVDVLVVLGVALGGLDAAGVVGGGDDVFAVEEELEDSGSDGGVEVEEAEGAGVVMVGRRRRLDRGGFGVPSDGLGGGDVGSDGLLDVDVFIRLETWKTC